jgi:gluconate 2-dehydrogenase gamma chain
MSEDQLSIKRRELMKGALLGTVGAVLPLSSEAVAAGAAPAEAPVTGYLFFTPAEATFMEALADHMVPEDVHTPKGSDLGIPAYADRQLAGSFGQGQRMYLAGPWAKGLPSQGYQSPLKPNEVIRSGIEAFQLHCTRTFQKPFERLLPADKDAVLKSASEGKIEFANALPSKFFFDLLYKLVVEGMFSDPAYGGNQNKRGWAMLGFPGVIETHAENIKHFKNKPFPHQTLGIQDAS